MRRAIASVMLVLISFPLIGGGLFADASSGVPSCCRRNGQHHCEMAAMDSSSQGEAVLPARCASWPRSAIAQLDVRAPLPVVSPTGSQPLSHSAISFSSQGAFWAQYQGRVLKRGPPVRFD